VRPIGKHNDAPQIHTLAQLQNREVLNLIKSDLNGRRSRVYSLEGEVVEEKIELPEIFMEVFRPDLIKKKQLYPSQTARIQPWGTDPRAGKRKKKIFPFFFLSFFFFFFIYIIHKTTRLSELSTRI